MSKPTKSEQKARTLARRVARDGATPVNMLRAARWVLAGTVDGAADGILAELAQRRGVMAKVHAGRV